MRESVWRVLVRLSLILLIALAAAPAGAQPGAFGVCVPASQRNGRDVGCFIVSETQVGRLGPQPVFWHVVRFASRALADAANRDSGTVIEAYGGEWLLKVGAAGWRSAGGQEVAKIGPLPVQAGTSYSALYMEASMRPGMKSAIHRHSGPEAWYTLSGETCLETPAGTQVGRAGGPPVIVPGGPPMELTATGKTLRRSLVLILHDSSKPPTTVDTVWTPRGSCRPQR